MALMVIVGTTAAWKARAVSVAREAVWRTNLRRTGASDPHPIGWPANARLDVRPASRDILPSDPLASHAVVRGPVLSAPTGEAIPVRPTLTDMHGGLTLGVAGIERAYPMMQRMGRVRLEREHPLLHDHWGYLEMGYGTNGMRRIPVLYPIDLTGAIPAETQRFQEAAVALVTNPFRPILETLDNDPELQRPQPSGMRYDPPYGIGFAPDYHFPETNPLRAQLFNPQLICSFEQLQRDITLPMTSEIAGVPSRLTRDFLRMYRQHRQHCDTLLHLLGRAAFPGDMPPRPAQLPVDVVAYLQSVSGQMYADRQRLTQYIEQLERFEQLLAGP